MADAEPIYKLHAEVVPLRDAQSTQATQDDPDLGTPDGAIEPPVPLGRLKAWTEINGTRKACLDAIVRNTVGLGYRIEMDPDTRSDEDDPDAGHAELRTALEQLAAADRRLHRPTFTALMKAVKHDEQEVGQGGIEVARSPSTGQISGLFHVPGHRIRRAKDRKGYLVVPSNGDLDNAIPYYEFGEKVTYTRDGKPLARLAGGKQWATNEILLFTRYTSESRDYGLPADSALAVEYLGDQLAASANVGFFDSSGTPPTVLFVQGEERKDGSTIRVSVPPETSSRIQQTLKSGGDRQSRVAIIPIPAGVKVQREELGKVSDRDLGFVDFRDDMRQRTLSAFRIGPVFIALDSSGRYDAEVQRALAKEQVFDGEQTEWEDRLHASILRELGAGERRVRFIDLRVEDDAAKREGAVRMAEAGVIKRREYRTAFGYPPLPEGTQPGQVPVGWNDEIIDLGQPAGAENRAPESGQAGLTPGIGARAARSGPNAQPRSPRGTAPTAGQPPVEAAVAALSAGGGARVRGGARRAISRARALVDEG